MIEYTLKEIASITSGQLIGEANKKIKGIHFDSRKCVQDMLFCPIVGEKVDGHSFVADLLKQGIAGSFWQKGNSNEIPQGNIIIVDDVVTAMQKLAAHYRQTLKCHFIGITGSSGKTSTKDIIASVVSQKYKTYKTLGNMNNDLGVPVTICNIPEDIEYAVCEMGINDFGVMDRLADMVQPELTVITSIGPAHIAQLQTIDHIVEQKCLINKYLKNGTCFYNSDSYGLEKQMKVMHLENNSVGYGFKHGSLQPSNVKLTSQGTTFDFENKTYTINVLGEVQVYNGLAAIGLGRQIGLSDEQINEGLKSVVLTAHRMQIKHISEGTVIDDTYNANPSSMVGSLKTMLQYDENTKKVIVIGDMKELGETSKQLHESISDEIDFSKFYQVYLVGEDMKALASKLERNNIKTTYKENIEGFETELKQYLNENTIIFFKASNSMNFASIIDKLED